MSGTDNSSSDNLDKPQQPLPPTRKREETSPLRFDRQFIEICKDVGFVPKYQCNCYKLSYQSMKESVMEKAEKTNLLGVAKKKVILTHSILRLF